MSVLVCVCVDGVNLGQRFRAVTMNMTMRCLLAERERHTEKHRGRERVCVYSRGSGPGSLSGLAGRPTTPLADKA